MSSRWMRNSFIYLLITVAVIAIFFTLFGEPLRGSEEISINEVVALAIRQEVVTIEVRDDDLDVTTVSGGLFTSRKEKGSTIVGILSDAGIDPTTSDLEIIVKGSSGWSSIFGLLFNFLPLILFGGLLIFIMRQAQGGANQTMSFGRSKARMIVANKPTVTFADVAGVDEAKMSGV